MKLTNFAIRSMDIALSIEVEYLIAPSAALAELRIDDPIERRDRVEDRGELRKTCF